MLEKILRTVSVAAALAMILPAAVRAEAEFTMKVAIANPILDMHHSWTPHLVLKNEIEKVSTSEVKVRVLHTAVGGITQSDILLADASNAVVIGFNVIASGQARRLADDKNVEIRNYQVIYHITEDIRKAAEGLLEPELRQEVLGHAEVRQVFKVTKVGAIAGCYVTDGVVQRDALIRVTRSDVVIENDRVLEQLKRFKDDAKEVRSGMECGMKIRGYDDIKEGDILECYRKVEVRRSL